MEAWRFGFDAGVSSGYKFDPTDADIVAFYLLPRAINLDTNPYEHAIIDADPASLPPWELFETHSHADSDHAFFFGPPRDKTKNGGRVNRAVKGGTWCGQKSSEEILTLLRPGGGELDVQYKKYNLTFYRTGEKRTSGWVMHEYEILSPPLPGTVLTRIRITDKGKEMRQKADAAALAATADHDQLQVIPCPEELGLSDQNHGVTGDDDSEGCDGGAQAGLVYGDNGAGDHMGETTGGEGCGGGAQAGFVYGDNSGDMGETMAGYDHGYYPVSLYAGESNSNNYYQEAFPGQEQPMLSHRADLTGDGEGFSGGAQADFFYGNYSGGDMGEMAGYADLFGAGEGGGDNIHYDYGDGFKHEPDDGQGTGY